MARPPTWKSPAMTARARALAKPEPRPTQVFRLRAAAGAVERRN
jgi:hypothetical protein